MGEPWPAPPDWLELDVAPRRLRRGAAVTVALRAPLAKLRLDDYELGLACLAHYATVESTHEGDAPGRFRMDRQQLVWEDWHAIPGAAEEQAAPPGDEAPYAYPGETSAPGPLRLAVPPDAPYSYEGDLLSFYWAVWLRARLRPLRPTAYVPLVVEP
jgi:hypothetical protein